MHNDYSDFTPDPWITSWFMAVNDKGHYQLFDKITQRIASYWNDNDKTSDKNHFYFWFHRIVALLYNEDFNAKHFMENQEDAAGPHCFKFEPRNQKLILCRFMFENIFF